MKKCISSLLVLGLLLSCTMGDYSNVVAKKNPQTCSVNEFKKIKKGMSLKKVRNIIGSSGNLISKKSVGGYKTTMYKFKGSTPKSTVFIQFNNGKVYSKTLARIK